MNMLAEGKSLSVKSLVVSSCLGLAFVPFLSIIFSQLLFPLLGYLAAVAVMSSKTLFLSATMLGRLAKGNPRGWERYSALFYLITFVSLFGLVAAGYYIGKPFLAGVGAGVVANTIGVGAWGFMRVRGPGTC